MDLRYDIKSLINYYDPLAEQFEKKSFFFLLSGKKNAFTMYIGFAIKKLKVENCLNYLN